MIGSNEHDDDAGKSAAEAGPSRGNRPTRTRVLKIVRGVLLVWGGLSLVGFIAVTAFVAARFGPGNRNKDDSASPMDVRFVLNWCELGDQRFETVVHSHVSARSLTGDHLDAYAIKISHVDLAELTSKADASRERWYRGDQLPKVLDDAVSLVGFCRLQFSWFPAEADLRSSEFYVYPWSIGYHGVDASDATLVFVRPSDKMVFYFEVKT
ncbi:MAG: hypothetical protein HZB26_24760 [Candidatus Hydrogenedentes bacterium]|nr:hypothetical protein [Candidatus Hydrogenedentota bacterium]